MEQLETPSASIRLLQRDESLSRYHKDIVVYVLLSVVFAGWFAMGLTKLSLWTDEWMTLYYSRSAEATVMDAYHPPLYYFMIWLWRVAVPLHPTISTRAFSVVFLIVTLLLWIHMWRSHLNGARFVPILAGALCALSPHMILYGRMGRHFTLTACLVAVAIYCFMQLGHQRRDKAMVGMLLSHVLLALEDYWALAVVAASECVYLALWNRDLLRALIVPVGGGVGVILIANLALKLQQAAVVTNPGATTSWKAGLLAIAYPFGSLILGENISRPLLILAGPAVVGWMYLVVRLMASADGASLPNLVRLGLVIVCVSTLGCAMMVIVGSSNLDYLKLQTAKLFFPFAPMFYMLAAYVLGVLIKGAKRWIILIVVGSTLVVGTAAHHRGEGFLHPVHNMPWMESATKIVGSTSASDAVFTVDWAFADYFKMLGGKATLVVLGDDLSAVHQKKYEKIWLVTRPIPHAKYGEYFSRVEAAMNGQYRLVLSVDLGEEGEDLIWLREKLMGMSFKYRVGLRLYERLS